MNKERVQKLIVALRSGNYKQGKGYLHQDSSWCCLGVACDIVKNEVELDWELVDPYRGVYIFEGSTRFLKTRVYNLYNFVPSDTKDLMRMNDQGDSFEEIANYLESKI